MVRTVNYRSKQTQTPRVINLYRVKQLTFHKGKNPLNLEKVVSSVIESDFCFRVESSSCEINQRLLCGVGKLRKAGTMPRLPAGLPSTSSYMAGVPRNKGRVYIQRARVEISAHIGSLSLRISDSVHSIL